MQYITEKPKAQGTIEYGHFRAEVKIYSSSDVRYTIEMIAPVEATKYNEYWDYTRWAEEMKREISVIELRISNFEFDCARGKVLNAV